MDTVYIIWDNYIDDICCFNNEWNIYKWKEQCEKIFNSLTEEERDDCEIVETTRDNAYNWLRMYHESDVWW